MRTHFVQHSNASLLKKGTHTLHQIIIALNYSHSWLVVAHHSENTESGKALFLRLQAQQHHRIRLPAHQLSNLRQKAQRTVVTVGNSVNIRRAEFFLQIFGSSKAFVAQHNIHLCPAHILQLLHARVAAKAGVTAQLQRFAQQTLYLPYIAFHAVTPHRGAYDIVHAFFLRNALLRQITHQQLIRFSQTNAVIAAEAALLKGYELSLDLILHITAHTLDIGADNGSYGRCNDKNNLRRIIFIQFDKRILQTCYVAHDNIVLAHMRGEEAVLKAQAQASV